ncbi:hypothetical protein [Xanthobacter variabilis]|uniref:hypothetical protein n=1 Tax=Xanthobacter variabilis TaxID=3119932 RepID=UPI00372A00D0
MVQLLVWQYLSLYIFSCDHGHGRLKGAEMFNLLVKYEAWRNDRDAFSIGRIFERTIDDIKSSHLFDGKPDLNKLRRYPCLFMQEGVGDEVSRVGRITQAKIVGNEVVIDYIFENDIPNIKNSEIYLNLYDFDMDKYEFSRTHWAVKDVDLYRVLLRNFQPRRQRPKVFAISEQECIEPELASAMMPFDASFNGVYDVIKSATDRVGLRCRRADDIWENPNIIQDIVSLIDRSRIVICDCTNRNPNVFYEIGIAHTLGRDVILVVQNESDIPFDLRHLRYITYLNNVEGRGALGSALEARIKRILGQD